MNRDDRMYGRGGFSLIELLVVIGVIGVLIAIILPALGKARSSAYQTVALSNVRSVGTQFVAHEAERGEYPQQDLGEVPAGLDLGPSYEPRGDEIIIPWYPRGIVIASTDYFEHAWMWPAMLTPLDDWPEHWETWISPRKDEPLPKLEDFGFDDDRELRDYISVVYSNSFVVDPRYFDGTDRSGDDTLLRGVRSHDVRYPSDKVMLWDDDLSYLVGRNAPERVEGLLDATTPMFFADGHGEALNPLDAGEAVENPRADHDQATRLHSTKNGVHGRDY